MDLKSRELERCVSAIGCTLMILAVVLPMSSAFAHEPHSMQMEQVNRAIEREPLNHDLYQRRAELNRIGESWEQARRDLYRAQALGADQAMIALRLSALELDLGEAEEALRLLDQVIEQSRPSEYAFRLRARAREAIDDPTSAALDLEYALAITKRPTPQIYLWRSRLLRKGDPAATGLALQALNDGIERLGPVATLVLAAIELELEIDGNTAAARQVAEAGTQRPSARSFRRLVDVSPLEPETTQAQTTITVTRGPYLQVATDTSIVIRWRTNLPVDSEVRLGDAPDFLTFSVSDTSQTTEHELLVGGLTPLTRYFYTIGTTTQILAGADSSFAFVTSPPPGTEHSTRIWVIGDGGFNNVNSRGVRDAFLSYSINRPADLWLMLGDNAYTTGTDAEHQAAIFDMYPELLRRTPLWPTRGNHEFIYAGPNNDYYEIFTLPTDGAAGGLASGDEAYYSFDYGEAHFVCLDSYASSREPNGDMLTWLNLDLAATDQKWIIAYWHHPPYSKGSHDSDNLDMTDPRLVEMRENVLPILERHGVDVVLGGHSHVYERSFLLDQHYGYSWTLADSNKIDPNDGQPDGGGAYQKPTFAKAPHEGAVYIVAGCASLANAGPLDHPVMVSSLLTNGSVIVDINGNRLDAVFLDKNEVVQDHFTLIKGVPTSVEPRGGSIAGTRLLPARPNPAAGPTQIIFELSRPASVRLRVFDTRGRRVQTLVNGALPAGRHTSIWRGTDESGRAVTPGVYFGLLEVGEENLITKIVLVE